MKGKDNSGGSLWERDGAWGTKDRDRGRLTFFFHVYLATFDFFTTCVYSPFKINVIKTTTTTSNPQEITSSKKVVTG